MMAWNSNSTISREQRSHGYKTPFLSSGEKEKVVNSLCVLELHENLSQ